ncbi:MAG: hypothetical protein JST89_00120 [Cyanobacteria bacterium SZAS-4]|nr:hypothetical protein [Cyanobacteria bacterium SZAS-4]
MNALLSSSGYAIMKINLLLMPLLAVLCLSSVCHASAAGHARRPGPQWHNGLPPTRLDSFVREAKGSADAIYGDEGSCSIPPFFGFEKWNRINAGIMDDRNRGLTTGHGSYLPDAAGNDEFLGAEWSHSGARGRNEALEFQVGTPVVRAESVVRRFPGYNPDDFDMGGFERNPYPSSAPVKSRKSD